MQLLPPNSPRLLSYMMGVAALLFAAGFFLRSLPNAQANGAENQGISSPIGLDNSGRYMMFPYNKAIHNSEGEFVNWENNILVWDTESGKSLIYWFGNLKDEGFGYYPSRFKLPEKPL